MDVYGVPEEYTQVLENHKKLLQRAKLRQGQRPGDRQSKDDAYLQFMQALMFSNVRQQQHLIHSSFIPPAYLPCVTPVAELHGIGIQHLQLETHHRGRYIILRSMTPPRRMTAIMALMEDERGDSVLLQMYQQETEDVRKASDIIDIGTIMLVKEPYYKVMGDGGYGLRVDHLSDVIRVKENDVRIPQAWKPRAIEAECSAESLKIKGNLAMKEGRHWNAIMDYSYALRQEATAEEIQIIKRNRSLAFLRTKQFDAALSDTGFPVLFSPKPFEKAFFRAAEALYGLERFNECCAVLEDLRTNFPSNKEALVLLARARLRSLEQQTGKYNFKRLQAEAGKLRPPHLDHATYVGPVEVKWTESKGRGLFTTRSVKAGDLLLCEKAFKHAYANELASGDGSRSEISLLMNTETNQGFMGTQASLINLIVQKLYRNPSLASTFNALHHGSYKAVDVSDVDGQPIVDTFLVERIMSLNVFGSPVSSLLSHKEVCGQAPASKEKTSNQKVYHSSGIWTQASYINHSCTSTACRAFIGDMMIVRATQDLESGAEITFWYKMPDNYDVKELQENHKHWGFICDCAICQDGRTTSADVTKRRSTLIEKLKRVMADTRHFQVHKFERLLEALDATYTRPPDQVPRLLLWDPLLALTRAHVARNDVTASLKFAGKVLTSLGFTIRGTDSSSSSEGFAVVRWGIVVDHVVETFLHVRTALAAMGSKEDSRRAEGYARTCFKILVGEDSSFDGIYG